MTKDEVVDGIYAVSSFLVGYGDVAEIAASRLRELAARIDEDGIDQPIDSPDHTGGE